MFSELFKLGSEGEKKDDRNLEEEIENLEEKLEKYKKRFEAEKSRRAELSRQKQNAEEDLKKAKNRLRNIQQDSPAETNISGKDKTVTVAVSPCELAELVSSISGLKNGFSLYVSDWSELNDLRSVKDHLGRNLYKEVEGRKNFVLYKPSYLPPVIISLNIDFTSWYSKLDISPLDDFINSEKTYVRAGSGNTKIIRSQGAQVSDVVKVESRVDSKHTKGGFSQKRFSKKREDQVKQHFNQVKQKLGSKDERVLIVGPDKVSEFFSTKVEGGFDSSRNGLASVYNSSVKYFLEESEVRRKFEKTH